ncbi:MAG: hypothetical protein NTX22_15655 [Ignavibacteriales bacterium]|nr:hypothetical protein [Ignavibacteriales bacterium]
MGLLPIIFTALTIFSISLIVVLSISYVIYKLRPNHRKPLIQDNQIETFSFPGNSNEPSYDFLLPVNDISYYQEPKTKRNLSRNNYNKNENRFEIVNEYHTNYYHAEPISQSFTKNFRNNQNTTNVFDNYADFSSNDLRMLKVYRS